MYSIIPIPENIKAKEGCFVVEKSSQLEQLVTYVQDTTIAPEGYCLEVSESCITVKHSNEAGAFYALQTLLQLSKAHTNDSNLSIPACKIIDKPRFSHRGFMLDEARHFWGKAKVKQTLDMMAYLKMNIFHWHLTEDQGWRIEIKKYPLLTQKGNIRNSTQLNLVGYNSGKEKRDNVPYGKDCFYTQDDIKEIVAYAKDRHIEVIPEIDMPGHLVAAIACYPYLSCEQKPIDVCNRWGVMDTIGCVGRDDIFKFVYDIIDELVELFPSKYFHIGGDEVPKTKWKSCPNCQKRIKELGLKDENQLQGYFNNQVQNYLQSKGKHMIGWNEILEASTLTDNAIVQWWTGNANRNGVTKWLEKGNNIIMSNVAYVYADHFYAMKDLKKLYSLDLKTVGLDEKYENKVFGFEMPLWTEYIRDTEKFDFNTYPRMQALAEIAWAKKSNRDFANFEARLSYHNEIMQKMGINYAPKTSYTYDGIGGFFKRLNTTKHWITDSYFELNNKK